MHLTGNFAIVSIIMLIVQLSNGVPGVHLKTSSLQKKTSAMV